MSTDTHLTKHMDVVSDCEKHCITGTYTYIGFSLILEISVPKQFPTNCLTKDIWVVRIKWLSLFSVLSYHCD